MNTPTKATIAILGLGSMLLLTLAMPVQAQQQATVQFSFGAINGAIKPEGAPVKMNVVADLTMGSNVVGAGGVLYSSIPITITPVTCASPGILVTGPASIVVEITSTQAGQTSSYSGDADFYNSASRDVPGLKLQQCTFKGTVPDYVNAATSPGSSATQTFTVTVDYFPLISARVATKIQQSGPQTQIPFDIQLENKGNAQTKVLFTLGNVEESSKWNPILPEVIDIDSFADTGGKTTDTVTFTVGTPFKNGWNNAEKSFQVLMTTSASLDPSKPGNTLSASVLARVRGIYVPGFDPILMVGAVLGTALLARLKKVE